MEDQAAQATNVEQSVGVDEKSIDPADEAFVDRHEDFHEEKENGKLGEHDPNAVHDRVDVLKLEGVSYEVQGGAGIKMPTSVVWRKSRSDMSH